MTISFEIDREHSDRFPPFADGCETCLKTGFTGVVVPHATLTQGDTLVAFYHHARCGKQWFTSWGAAWDRTWKRVGPGGSSVIDGRSELRGLPAPRRSA